MSTLLEDIRHEIVDMHDLFTMWFNGTMPRDHFEERLLSRFHPDFTIIPPEGSIVTRELLSDIFQQVYGTNKNFRIQIRDVVIRHKVNSHVLARRYAQLNSRTRLEKQIWP